MKNKTPYAELPAQRQRALLSPALCSKGGEGGTPLSVFLLVAIFLLCATSTRAQNYSIGWFTIDGGGGTSTGGVYQVRGTIGQPDAGLTMSGGNFFLTGGFWS